jgi:hypothetical protein
MLHTAWLMPIPLSRKIESMLFRAKFALDLILFEDLAKE